jgi:hypothetical protein
MIRLLWCAVGVVLASVVPLTSSCGSTDDLESLGGQDMPAETTTVKEQALFSDGSSFTCDPAVATETVTSIPGSGVQNQPVTIVIPTNAPAPLSRAVEDLKEDLYNLFGRPAGLVPIVTDSAPSTSYNSIVVTMAGASNAAGYHDPNLSSFESHKIATKQVGSRRHIVLDGADLRGAIYAIYTFSDKILGVPPIGYWVAWEPTPLPNGQHYLKMPNNACRKVEAADTKYRAFFFNDKDYIDSWWADLGADPSGDTDDPEKFDKVFETLLRLKVNVFYDQRVLRAIAAAGYGLMSIYDMASFRYWADWADDLGLPAKPDASDVTSDNLDLWCNVAAPGETRPGLVEYWDSRLSAIRDREYASNEIEPDVIWLFGVRTAKDGTDMWADIENAPQGAAAQGTFEERAAACQKRLTLARYADSAYSPKYVLYLWDQLNDVYATGHLNPTASMTISFGNDIRTHVPTGSLMTIGAQGQPVGYYQNLQFTSTGSHLVDGTGPWKAVHGFKLASAEAGGPVRFGMVNVGNFREFLLSAHVVADMWWDISRYQTNTHAGTDSAVDRVFKRYLPSRTTAQVESLRNLHKEFLDAYWRQNPDAPGLPARQYIWEDLRMYRAIKDALEAIAGHQAVASYDYDAEYLQPIQAPSGMNETEAIRRGITTNSPTSAYPTPGAIYAWREILERDGGIEDFIAPLSGSELRFVRNTVEQPVRVLIEAARVNYYVALAFETYLTDVAQAKSHLCSAAGSVTEIGNRQNWLEHGIDGAAYGDFRHFYDRGCGDKENWNRPSVLEAIREACDELGPADCGCGVADPCP